MLTGTIPARDLARKLRRTMSLPEVLLWQRLRRGPGGFKFRRQHPAGDYVLDFYCSQAMLAIEVDGATHGSEIRGAFDMRRDAWLNLGGVRCHRISALAVLRSVADVVESIVLLCVERVAMPLHHAVKNGVVLLPEVGEDFRVEDTRWTI